MAALVHFLTLTTLPIVAVAAAWRGRKAPPSARRVIGTASLGLTPPLLIPGHLCDKGNPDMQLALAVFCFGLPMIFIGNVGRAVPVALGLALPVILVAFSYGSLVHEDGWTGNPRAERRALEWRTRSLAE